MPLLSARHDAPDMRRHGLYTSDVWAIVWAIRTAHAEAHATGHATGYAAAPTACPRQQGPRSPRKPPGRARSPTRAPIAPDSAKVMRPGGRLQQSPTPDPATRQPTGRSPPHWRATGAPTRPSDRSSHHHAHYFDGDVDKVSKQTYTILSIQTQQKQVDPGNLRQDTTTGATIGASIGASIRSASNQRRAARWVNARAEAGKMGRGMGERDEGRGGGDGKATGKGVVRSYRDCSSNGSNHEHDAGERGQQSKRCATRRARVATALPRGAVAT